MSQNTTNEEVSTSGIKTEKFVLKSAFLKLLESVGASGKVFTLSQILGFMKNYIIAHNLYDKKNPRQIFCEDDDLGKVLGVNKFTIDDVMKLLTRVLYRLPPTTKDSSESSENSQIDSLKRPPAAENVECKKQKLEDHSSANVRPKSPIIICIPDKPDYDSTCETDLSIQSHETALAKDSTDDLWFLEEDEYDVEVEDDDDYFSVEYELGSQSSMEGSLVSDTDSDIEDVINAVLICKDDDDMEFWADDSSDDDDFSTDPELEEGDKWTCSRCKSLNPPPMRYCQKCWDERIGWLPESRRHHPPPPRKSRKKRRMNKNQKLERKNTDSKPEKVDDALEAKLEKEESLKSVDDVNLDNFYPASTSYSIHKSTTDSEASIQPIKLCENPSVESFPDSYDKTDCNSVPPSAAADKESNVCPLCLQKEKTAIIVHGRTGHQMCCYPCARHLENQNKPCPICRRTIQRVIRNFYV
ncbi:E3 ubiquitin-protein ligase Mdm2-like [Centruroides vittatus]|uniref:E3 ubiquitin-protein ligase Mdm2-like n=1 Tax=Centruroides vittatus TaxID=120091 RepID=UPI00350F660D